MRPVVGVVKEHVTDLIGQMEIMAHSDPERVGSIPRILGGKVIEIYDLPGSTVVVFDDGTGKAQAHLIDSVQSNIVGTIRPNDLVAFEGHVDFCQMPDQQQRITIYPYLAFKIQPSSLLSAS